MKIWNKIIRHIKHRATRIKTYLSVILAAMIQYQPLFEDKAWYPMIMLALTITIGVIGGGVAGSDKPSA